MTNFRLFQTEEFADDNFKFDKNGRKLFKRVENIVGKGEIARYEQFLLFPQCFQKACFPGASKGAMCGNGLMVLKKTAPENTCLKRRKYDNQHCVLFPYCFLHNQTLKSSLALQSIYHP